MSLFCLCAPEVLESFSHPAVVVGHPGHELKVFGWIAEHRPQVHVITDGSGRHGVSRLPSTAKLLAGVGAKPGEVFGAVSDAEIYRALLETNIPFFLGLRDRLAESFLRSGIDFLCGDATEGFNPTHDICRALVNAAVAMAERTTSRRIPNYEFCLTEWEQSRQDVHDRQCLHLRLEEDVLRRKLEAALGYGELKDEVEKAIAARGERYFQIECLRRVSSLGPESEPAAKPFYETFGEQRVAEGGYASVIRYKQHMAPVLEALGRAADRGANHSCFSMTTAHGV
jgi:hypothetical protein